MNYPSAWLCHQVKHTRHRSLAARPLLCRASLLAMGEKLPTGAWLLACALQGKPAGNGGACSQEPASLPVCREEGVLARFVCLQEQVDPRRVAHRVTCRATVLKLSGATHCPGMGKRNKGEIKYSRPGAGMK